MSNVLFQMIDHLDQPLKIRIIRAIRTHHHRVRLTIDIVDLYLRYEIRSSSGQEFSLLRCEHVLLTLLLGALICFALFIVSLEFGSILCSFLFSLTSVLFSLTSSFLFSFLTSLNFFPFLFGAEYKMVCSL